MGRSGPPRSLQNRIEKIGTPFSGEGGHGIEGKMNIWGLTKGIMSSRKLLHPVVMFEIIARLRIKEWCGGFVPFFRTSRPVSSTYLLEGDSNIALITKRLRLSVRLNCEESKTYIC